jgi:coenzyme F420-reducing hydrogenase gamma subunit
MAKKLNIGIFSFTSDEGCVINFVEILNDKFFEWIELVNFKHARVLKTKNELKDLDVAFVEGAISNKKEEKKLKEIRKNSKIVVAIGSCAITGAPSNHRNFFNKETLEAIKPFLQQFEHREKVSPLHEIIKVDDTVPGCPIVPEKFVEVMEKYLKQFGVVKNA